VKDGVAARRGGPKSLGIEHVSAMKLRGFTEPCRAFGIANEGTHAPAVAAQPLDEVRPDQSRRAGDESAGH
jgi:hypothetical protein